MRKINLALILICCCHFCYSQKYNVTTVKAGDELDIHSQYRFAEFTPGEVHFKAGGTIAGKFNFNMLTCKMDFINPAGDTLAIAKPEQVASIQVAGSTFYYAQDYHETIAENDSCRLVVVRKVTVEPVKIGAMGLRNKNGAVEDYSVLLAPRRPADLILNEDVDIKRQDIYILITPAGEFTANRAAFVKLFQSRRPGVDAFIKKEKTDFFKEDSVKKLFDYCVKP